MEEQETNKTTPICPWGVGGPRTAEHKALAKQWFLEELPRCHTVSSACDYAHIDRVTAYKWKDQDKKFSDTWDRAVERTHDIARASIFQRGILGWDEPVVAQGQVVYEYEPVLDNEGKQTYDDKGKPIYKRLQRLTVHKWSDSLASLYAKANLPEYRDKQTIDVNLQVAEQAEKAKESLLASLGAAIDKNSEAAPQG